MKGSEDNVVATVSVIRERSEEKKMDKVTIDQDKTKGILQEVAKQDQSTVQVTIEDIPDDKADEVKLTINNEAVKELADGKVTLELNMDNVSVHLSNETLQKLSDKEEDIFFRIVPIRDTEQQTEILQNSVTAEVVVQAAGSNEITALGMPMKIETNYQGITTKVMFSLKDIVMPADKKLRAEFLNSLGIYINHSDGEQEFTTGIIQYDEAGNPVGN